MKLFKQKDANLIAEETEFLPRVITDNVLIPVLFGVIGFGLFYVLITALKGLSSQVKEEPLDAALFLFLLIYKSTMFISSYVIHCYVTQFYRDKKR